MKLLRHYIFFILLFTNHLNAQEGENTMQVKSSAFLHRKPIPQKYTCDGEDLSPPLTFGNLPANTESLAIIVDDPDAPSGVFVHWVVWNLPGHTASLPEGAKVSKEGKNHFGELHYRGPCPPRGKPHHYHFKLYSLDKQLDLPEGSSKEQLLKAMDGHILAQGELIGTYQRE